MKKKRAGLSLVEVMVAMTLFTFTSIAVAKTLMHARRQAEVNVHTITINTVVKGYLEQMKSITMTQLTGGTLPTVRLSSVKGEIVEADDPMVEGIFNAVIPVDVNNTETNTADDIRLEIQPLILDLRDDVERPRIDITLNYRWEQPSKLTDDREQWVTGSFRYVRSRIRNF